MSDPDRQFRLRINGTDYRGWKTLAVATGLENAASSFSFAAAPRYPGEPNPARIVAGSKAQILLGDVLLTTAFVDKWNNKGGPDTHALTLSGRSKTQDIIDSDVEASNRITNRTLPQIARQVCAPFGVDVVVDPVLAGDPIIGRKFKSFKIKTGEKVFAALERAARSRCVVLTDNAAGELVISRVVTSKLPRAHTAIVMGENVHAFDLSFDASQLYTRYVCKGQRAPSNGDSGDDTRDAIHSLDDPFLEGRTRTLIIQPEGRATKDRCRQRATWEAAARFGKANTLIYELQGWLQGDGTPWVKGQLVSVFDELNGVSGEWLVIAARYNLTDAAGSTTALTLQPPEAYELLTPIERAKKRGGTRKGKGGFAEIKEGVTLYQNDAQGFTDPVAQTIGVGTP